MAPVTVCTDMLKVGGYGRAVDYLQALAGQMKEVGAASVDEFIVRRAGAAASARNAAARANMREAWQKALSDPHYTHAKNSLVPRRVGSRLTYEYDLADGWMHEVVVERILPREPGVQYPLCLDGERACPPEDVGGINGYYDFLDALQNARLAGHTSALEWIGGHFEPDVFDLETVNRRLRGLERHRQAGS